ncbi:MAG: response regulator [Candidatus Pacebacteria bacterium]|nr:response regulator [Candidatus Paceibacterota bacterium]
MPNSSRSSIFNASMRHFIFAVFALLALLPALALIRIGVLLLWTETLDQPAMFEIAGLSAFVLVSLSTGFKALLHINRKLQSVTQESRRLQKQTAAYFVPADWSAEGSQNAQTAALRQCRGRNELESLSEALNQIQTDMSQSLSRLDEQATMLRDLMTLLDQINDLVIIAGKDDRILYCNRAAQRYFGVITGDRLRYAMAEGALAAQNSEQCLDILESWETRDEEIAFRRLDGTSVTLHVLLNIAENEEDGKASRKIITARDVTQLNRLERQLYRSEKLASLGQLISGVAHELNNPLAAILGFAELCRNSHDKKDIGEELEVIEREARRTAHIVENLLTFSRQRKKHRTPTDVHELLERCFALVAYNFRTTGLTVRRDYNSHLPSLMLDGYQVQQVFMNIILNAAQALKDAATPDPCIQVSTTIADDQTSAIVEIADNGPGIPEEDMDMVFKPFFTTKNEDQGTGLGLPVSLRIIQQHGGTIDVESAPSEGARFIIRLPVAESTRKRSVGVKPKPAIAERMRGHVLVVDDEPSVREMTNKILHRMGLKTTSADSLQNALAALNREDYDLVLVDVYMPDGRGTDLWKYVSRHQPELVERVIFITGDPRIEQDLARFEGQKVKVLLKPFHMNDLQRTVRNALESRLEV